MLGMNQDEFLACLLGIAIGWATMAWWLLVYRARPKGHRYDHEGPYRPRCSFVAMHECGCVFDAGHVELHQCSHGAVWGHELRPPPGDRPSNHEEVDA